LLSARIQTARVVFLIAFPFFALLCFGPRSMRWRFVAASDWEKKVPDFPFLFAATPRPACLASLAFVC
jgi:hypothetical protein